MQNLISVLDDKQKVIKKRSRCYVKNVLILVLEVMCRHAPFWLFFCNEKHMLLFIRLIIIIYGFFTFKSFKIMKQNCFYVVIQVLYQK